VYIGLKKKVGLENLPMWCVITDKMVPKQETKKEVPPLPFPLPPVLGPKEKMKGNPVMQFMKP